ncbi:hypothetical protein [Nonomuraea sp. NPDC049400]|uniref:hypothetical protein n=1 Tax=Nonomuraea sp. NPDC049400 TaxID=3364352 RepID=UPI00378806B5
MTDNKAQKSAARRLAATSGISYTAALWQLRDQAAGQSVIHARDVRAHLAATLQMAGWPVTADEPCDAAQYRLWAGPALVTIGRADQLNFWRGDEDPMTAIWSI